MALINTVTSGTVGTTVNYNSSGVLSVQLNGTTISKITSAPAFSAYQSTAQTISTQTHTKINFQTEEFDTNSNYSTSDMRFTPTVAGLYQISGGLNINGAETTIQAIIYKNGSEAKFLSNKSTASGAWGCALISLNGSTDYVELYVWLLTGYPLIVRADLTYFQGILVRAET